MEPIFVPRKLLILDCQYLIIVFRNAVKEHGDDNGTSDLVQCETYCW